VNVILTWQLNIQSNLRALVILAKAGIQQSQDLFWIPALRSAAAGMTSLIAELIIIQKHLQQIGIECNTFISELMNPLGVFSEIPQYQGYQAFFPAYRIYRGN
jgi:hypothetical protein